MVYFMSKEIAVLSKRVCESMCVCVCRLVYQNATESSIVTPIPANSKMRTRERAGTTFLCEY